MKDRFTPFILIVEDDKEDYRILDKYIKKETGIQYITYIRLVKKVDKSLKDVEKLLKEKIVFVMVVDLLVKDDPEKTGLAIIRSVYDNFKNYRNYLPYMRIVALTKDKDAPTTQKDSPLDLMLIKPYALYSAVKKREREWKNIANHINTQFNAAQRDFDYRIQCLKEKLASITNEDVELQKKIIRVVHDNVMLLIDRSKVPYKDLLQKELPDTYKKNLYLEVNDFLIKNPLITALISILGSGGFQYLLYGGQG